MSTVNDFTCTSSAPVPWRFKKLPLAKDIWANDDDLELGDQEGWRFRTGRVETAGRRYQLASSARLKSSGN